MIESPLHAFLNTQRNEQHYAYLLIDPLAGYGELDALAPFALTQALGDSASTIVLRPDLAHSPEACPRLITLAEPDQAVDPVWIEASLDRATLDASFSKRYVCGWFTCDAPPGTVAQAIAQRCIVHGAGPQAKTIPFFEPLRLELLAATSHDDLAGWLGDLHAWVVPNSSGSISLLKGSASSHWMPSEKTLQIQQDAPTVELLLSAWRYALRLPLTYAPYRWTGDSLLPPQAASVAWRQLRDARQLRLTQRADQIAFALHRLMIHPRIDEHSYVQQDLVRAARGETSLIDAFDRYGDHTWSNIVQALRTEA